MRSARLRFPSNINLPIKRATLRLLNLASGTSGRRTALFRLGIVPPQLSRAFLSKTSYEKKREWGRPTLQQGSDPAPPTYPSYSGCRKHHKRRRYDRG